MSRFFRSFHAWRIGTVYSANYHLEAFFVAAVLTVLAIRGFLSATGYPQLGGGGLHIAHLFWGGLLMLIAMVLQMTFLGDRPRGVAAMVGGIGFGFFIDELGKYFTKNSNYFFRPAVLLIYGFFLLLWMAFRALDRRRSTSRHARAANVLELLQEGMLYGFNRQEKDELAYQLKKLEESGSELASNLKELTKLIEKAAKADQPSLYFRLNQWVNNIYSRLVEWRFFAGILYLVFLIQGILSLANVIDFVHDLLASGSVNLSDELSRAQAAQLAGGILYAIIIIWGFWQLRRNSIAGFRTFKTALLVNIFVTQFFAFYRQQFSAATGLIFNLVLLGAVNYLIILERHRRHSL